MKHLISADDLDQEYIRDIFHRTDYFKKSHLVKGLEWHHISRRAVNRLLTTVFFEPSTRTRLSFESAMSYLGGNVIGTENAAEFSSVKKGGSIADEFKVISGYCDIIVGRFRNAGEAQIAANACDVPFINGGDGDGEHPTQALIDAYIIDDKLRHRESLTVTFLGDNEHSRTVKSLSKLLGRFDHVKINYFDMAAVSDFGLCQCLPKTDVLYLTRPQIERYRDSIIGDLPECFIFDKSYLRHLPDHALILHPLPRTTELPVEIDTDPRAHYFEQARNGLYIRMALLDEMLSDE